MFVCLLTTLVVVACNLEAQAANGSRKLDFEPAAPSFGVIRRALGEDLRLEVSVRNRSETAFDLREVQVGCGCMSVEVVSPGEIAPGEAGTLRVTLSHHRARVGRASYPLTVMDGLQVIASVPITYEYDPPIYADHVELFIDADEPREARAATSVWLRRRQPGDMAPKVVCDSPHFQANLRKPAESRNWNGQYSLEVTCAADALPAGTAKAIVAVYLSSSETPDLSIPVHCTVRPPVSAQPAALLLGAVRGGKAVRRVIRLTSRKPFTVESVAASTAQLSVNEKEGDSDGPEEPDAMLERSYEVVVSPDPGSSGAFEAEVRIALGGAVGGQIVVPVVAEVLAD